jgi:hypothetical protein
LVVAAASFYGGILYQKNQRQNFALGNNLLYGNNSGSARNGQTGTNRQGMMGNRTGFRPVNGEIINVDNKSITVKLVDGSSKIVFLSENTTVSRSTAGVIADLKKGEKVAAFGTENSDGSLSATSVQLNPLERNQSPPSKPNEVGK